MRRGLALLRSDVYRLAAVLFALNGLLWLLDGVQLGAPALVVPGLVLASYPMWTWAYTVSLVKKLDRAERSNADLGHRPTLYLVRPAGADMVSN